MQIRSGHWEVIRHAATTVTRARRCCAPPQIDSRPRHQIDYGNTDASLYYPVTRRWQIMYHCGLIYMQAEFAIVFQQYLFISALTLQVYESNTLRNWNYFINFVSCLITVLLLLLWTFNFVFSQRSIEKRTWTNQLAHHSKLFFSMAMSVPLLRSELCVFPLFIKRPLEAVQI